MAWGARNTLVILCIDIVFGRIDAPLGAEHVHFGIESGWEQGNVLTNIGRGVEGLGFNIAFVVGENVEEWAAARFVFSKANIRPVVQPEKLPWKFPVGPDHIVTCRHSGGCSEGCGGCSDWDQSDCARYKNSTSELFLQRFVVTPARGTACYIKHDSRPRYSSELGGFRHKLDKATENVACRGEVRFKGATENT